MIERFTDWIRQRLAPGKAAGRPSSAATALPANKVRKLAPAPRPKEARPQPEFVELDPHIEAVIEDAGPGKNVLIRKKYVREDTGTHDTLKIVDDSMLENDDESGIDPYNTGQFDRSKNWDRRFRK